LQRSTDDFRQVGYLNNQKPASLLWQSSVTRAFSNALSVSLGYLQRDGRTELDARALTSSINIRTGRGIITVGGLYSLLNHNQYGASISFTLPWKERSVTTTSGDVSGQSRTASIETRQQVGQGPGVGYRVKQTTLDQQRLEASLQAQDGHGSYQVETVQTPNDLSFRLSERSSISLVQGHLMTSRWLDDSFAVVRVPGAKSVPIYVNNQMLAKTDRRGLALIPWLIPYNRNQVHIDDSVLPLDRSYDMNDRHVVPMRRTGLLVTFEPTSMQGALLVLTQPDGTPLPYGTLVRINGKPEQYEVAMRGEVFVNTLSYPATVQATGPAVNCSLTISKTPSNDPLPKLGPLVCKEPR
jgi:outer membrane usher protein